MEHILPQAHGGTDAFDTLALACHACNLFKSDFETAQDEESQVEVALFHPRRDLWEQHFGVNTGAVIVGITSVGRATVVRVHMDRARHITARQRWIDLGLFPSLTRAASRGLVETHEVNLACACVMPCIAFRNRIPWVNDHRDGVERGRLSGT